MHRSIHRTAVGVIGLLLCAPVASSQASSLSTHTPASTRTAVSDPSARAARHWHPITALGSGKRKVRVAACLTGSDPNYTLHYRARTKKSSDRSAPRVELAVGSSFNAEFSLFPGDLTETSSAGYFGPQEVLTVRIHLLGQSKKRSVAIGRIGRC